MLLIQLHLGRRLRPWRLLERPEVILVVIRQHTGAHLEQTVQLCRFTRTGNCRRKLLGLGFVVPCGSGALTPSVFRLRALQPESLLDAVHSLHERGEEHGHVFEKAGPLRLRLARRRRRRLRAQVQARRPLGGRPEVGVHQALRNVDADLAHGHQPVVRGHAAAAPAQAQAPPRPVLVEAAAARRGGRDVCARARIKRELPTQAHDA
mmetsp:Transcript_59226/g.155978  ORF Transcript_59226/g.155978 Transcript_59226/m.155978 type:complete len:207 (+) Transcript_59226:828-1448(+)